MILCNFLGCLVGLGNGFYSHSRGSWKILDVSFTSAARRSQIGRVESSFWRSSFARLHIAKSTWGSSKTVNEKISISPILYNRVNVFENTVFFVVVAMCFMFSFHQLLKLFALFLEVYYFKHLHSQISHHHFPKGVLLVISMQETAGLHKIVFLIKIVRAHTFSFQR